MVDKRFPLLYSVVLAFFSAVMVVLMTVLFVEYRFFCNQVQEVMVLKQQYAQYVDLLNKTLCLRDPLSANSSVSASMSYDGDSHSSSSSIVFNGDLDYTPSSIVFDGDPDWSEVEIEVKEIMAAEASDEPDDDDDYADASFVVINRESDYLKQSTLEYMQTQDLNSLMTAIDVDQWSDYKPSTIVAPSIKKPSFSKKVDSGKNKVVQVNSANKPTHITAVRRPIKECGFMWPIEKDKFWLSSLFGPRKRIDGTWGFHHGIDMAAVKGTIVKAARAGTVTEASFQTGYGNTVVVQHTKNLKTRYAHLHTIRACIGQTIKQGAIVGTVGETGFIRKKGKDGSHLHFEVYECGKRVNPMHCLPRTA